MPGFLFFSSWFIMEQLPVIDPTTYTNASFGKKTAETIVREAVLELTYTATDLAGVAADLGHVDSNGRVKASFK